MNKDDMIKAQIDSLIRDEIQEVINEYVDTQEEAEKTGLGFVGKDGEDELRLIYPMQK